jgi:transposase InsO family protein
MPLQKSFFATLEKELLSRGSLRPRAETRRTVADYIDRYYNDNRRHSYLGFVSPLEYEMITTL